MQESINKRGNGESCGCGKPSRLLADIWTFMSSTARYCDEEANGFDFDGPAEPVEEKSQGKDKFRGKWVYKIY